MPARPDPLVIGLDAGGSSTRAVIISLTGERLGAGTAGGGNPTSHGAEPAAEQVRTALRTALANLDPERVRAGAIGLAGAGRWHHDPTTRAAYDRAWHDAGLRCRYDVHGDALVGYASATPTPDGTVVIAGTGAVAAQVRHLRLDRVADGHGWLLGDAGSGFWLGREAVRHALAELDAYPTSGSPTSAIPTSASDVRPALSPLTVLVLTELLGSAELTEPPRQVVGHLIRAGTRHPPVALARLAPLVFRAVRDGDPAARALVSSAAEQLVASVTRIRPTGDTSPIVLGGGLLTSPTPAGDEGPLTRVVAEALSRRWPGAPLLGAGDGAVGAAWLAARTLPGIADPAQLHRRLPRR